MARRFEKVGQMIPVGCGEGSGIRGVLPKEYGGRRALESFRVSDGPYDSRTALLMRTLGTKVKYDLVVVHYSSMHHEWRFREWMQGLDHRTAFKNLARIMERQV